MNISNGGRSRPRGRARSSSSIRLNAAMGDRRKAKANSRAAAKAEYLSTLPKERLKRLVHRLRPSNLAHYWFSREGGIMALKIIGIGIIVCFFLTIGLFAYFRKDLPKIKSISGNNLGGSISYYDRTGQVLLFQDYNAIKRTPVTSDNISPYMKQATVAVEDKNFYKEGAFDIRGIMRAGLHDVTGAGGGVQGGSTITQQLVKLNQSWTNDRTISRKVKELILAVELEREYSKNDILTGYLNIAPYGGIEYGVESAAEDYFHTSAKNLTLAQATMLAAIPKSPSYYSPYSSTQWNPAAGNSFGKQAMLDRQHYILDLMVQQGYVKKADADAAKKVDVLAQVQPLTNKYDNIKAPYFVLAAKSELEKKYGAQTVARGGWKVTTTLDMNVQTKAEQLVANNIRNVRSYGGDTMATVAEDVQTGQMVALVGGVDFNDPDHGKINYAQLNISPGSSFKPYDYTTLIENHTDVGAGSVLYDVQQPLLSYYPCTNKVLPKNGGNCLYDYDFRYPGALSLRYALAGSRNVPAVKAMLEAVPGDTSNGRLKSINKVISTANSMIGNSDAYKCYKSGADVEAGNKADEQQCYASSAIGDGAYIHLDQHLNGLSTLARMGASIPQTYILQISDSGNHTIYKFAQPKPKQVIRPDSAYIVDEMLGDPRATYLNPSFKFQNWNGWGLSVKTGTTNDNFDGLMMAWSPKYAVGSWVGYHTRNKAMASGGMENMTEPLTRNLIQYALTQSGEKPVNWAKPAGVKSLPGYVQRTHVGVGSQEPGPAAELFPSWYVGKTGTSTSAVIDKVSNGLATSCTPEAAKMTVGGANDNTFSADVFWPLNKSTSSSASASATPDNVHNCSDSPPSVTVTGPASGTCDSNDNGGQGCQITVVSSQGTHPLSGGGFGGTVNISVNGNVVSTQNLSGSPSTNTFYYKPTAGGSATVTATVQDSVLYQTTQSVTLTMSASASGQQGNNGNNGNGNGNRQTNFNLTNLRKIIGTVG